MVTRFGYHLCMGDGQVIFQRDPGVNNATLVLALSGWMDGGDVSTGTVERLIHLLGAEAFAEIDPDPYYIYNFPGSMDIAAIFRPNIEIEEGIIKSVEMPANTFYIHQPANLVFFVGQEPNLRWVSFGEALMQVVDRADVKRILFVGSFGGSVPHTREPRLYLTVSREDLLEEYEQYGLKNSTYEGPGSFTTYLMTRAIAADLDMASIVAEIPGYLQGTNPLSIEAVTRRLAKILNLPLDLAELRVASDEWETQVSDAVDKNEELAEKVRELEQQYDDQLIDTDTPNTD